MFLPFFEQLRAHKVPVSMREFLAFLEGMSALLKTQTEAMETSIRYVLGKYTNEALPRGGLVSDQARVWETNDVMAACGKEWLR